MNREPMREFNFLPDIPDPPGRWPTPWEWTQYTILAAGLLAVVLYCLWCMRP